MGFGDFFDEPKFDFEKERKAFVDNLNLLKTMSVEEQTLYKKWQEFNADVYSMTQKASKFKRINNSIWMPKDIDNKEQTIKEIEALEPYVEMLEQGNAKDNETWTLVRKLVHTMEFTANPGRNIKFFIKDRVTNKLLGVVCLGSDVTSLGARDNFIGWTKDNKFVDGKLKYTSIGTTICCAQPLGYNFLGGKLVAALVTTSVVRDAWKKLYGQTLVGLSTTSLYGIHSMYNSIPLWKTLGSSKGRIALKPDDAIYETWHDWLKENQKEEYLKQTTQKEGVAGPPTGVKQKVINMIFKAVGIKGSDYMHGFKRGIFYADIYENGKEFLRGEIEEKDLKMKKKYNDDSDYVMNWWKPKAIRRYGKLFDENRLKPEKLFYGDLVGMSWEEAKEKYLGEVGR
tara:strand:+ start:2299 stop:3492 length:1194 start_codon:yes stop_codon:yes gene_type:complete